MGRCRQDTAFLHAQVLAGTCACSFSQGARSMNTLVVYYSKFGNTKRIADAVAETCRRAGPVRIVRAEQLTPPDVNNVNLLVMGVPTHVANVPPEICPILDNLPQRVLEGVKFAAFDTSYHMNWFINLFTA